MASIPPVSKQLLLKYDSQFNKQLDRMNNLNNEITTKTRMINFNDQMTDQKDKKTIILTNVIWYLVILTVLLFLYLIGSVQLPLFIGMAVVIALIFVFRTYFTHFYRTDVDLRSISQETAQDFINNLESNSTDNYTCPTDCVMETQESTSTDTKSSDSITGEVRFLQTDSNRNVWLKGDLPNNTYTIDDENKTYRINGNYVTGFGYDKQPYKTPNDLPVYRKTVAELEQNRPQRQITPISKNYATYYDCSFIGGEDKNGALPSKTSYTKTTIPCNYYPGFREDARYICDSDMNCSQV